MMKLLHLFAVFAMVTAAMNTTKKPAVLSTQSTRTPWYDYDSNYYNGIDGKPSLFQGSASNYSLLLVYTYINWIYTIVCVLCLLINLLHLIGLACKKSHPLFTILAWICFSDILQCAGPLVMTIMDVYFTKTSHAICYGFPYYNVMTELVVESLKLFCSKFSALLSLFLAAYSAFSFKPFTMSLGMVLIGIVSAMWSAVYATQMKFNRASCPPWYKDNGGDILYTVSLYYTLSYGQGWELKYRMFDGFIAIGIAVCLALVGFAGCCKSESANDNKHGYPVKSSTLVIVISVFGFLFQLIYGLLAYIDNIVLAIYTEKVFFQLDRVIQIGLLLNSILKCFFYCCVSTKVKTTTMIPVRLAPPTVAIPAPVAPVVPSAPVAPVPSTASIAPTNQPLMAVPQTHQPMPLALPANHMNPAMHGFGMVPNSQNMIIPMGNGGHMMVPNMMIPNMVPTGNGQGNMQVSVVVVPIPGYSSNN